MTKAIHQYTASGYYAGAITDLGGVLPNNSTRTAPQMVDGYIPKWTGEEWTQVENHKGKQGYIGTTPHTVSAYGPLPEGFTEHPQPDEHEIARDAWAYVMAELTALDAFYLTPRTLAGLAIGDEYALARYREHEEKAEMLRNQLAAIPETEEDAA